MPILYTRPVKGMRQMLCKADEAVVSKLLHTHSRYDGMVERRQEIAGTNQFFTLHMPDTSNATAQCRIRYHASRFLALKAARALFPENFVDASEMRIYEERDGKRHAATYSAFVSDDTGVIERRRKTMRRYYAQPDSETRQAIRAAADRFEEELNPDLKPLSEKIRQAGITIYHHEANYHVCGGSTVFFEIDEIDVGKLVRTALEAGAKPAIEAMAAIYALRAKQIAAVMARAGVEAHAREYSEFAKASAQDVYAVVFNMLARGASIEHPGEFVRTGLERRKTSGNAGGWTEPEALAIDERVIGMMQNEKAQFFD